VLLVTVGAACRAPVPAPQPATRPAHATETGPVHAQKAGAADGGTLAIRYLVDVLVESRWHGAIAELWLPDAGVACNLASLEWADGALQTSANAFAHPRARNHDREGHERPTERVALPPAVAADIVELARLTERRRALAVRVAERLAPLVALDDGHEHTEFLLALRRAHERGADAQRLAAIEQRADALRMDWTLQVDHARFYRELRGELDALGR
jgi:hypothetical protein